LAGSPNAELVPFCRLAMEAEADAKTRKSDGQREPIVTTRNFSTQRVIPKAVS
jgi:hypothetical protein